MKNNILTFLLFLTACTAVSAINAEPLNEIGVQDIIPEARAEPYIAEVDGFDDSLPGHEHEIYAGVVDGSVMDSDNVREGVYPEDTQDLPADEGHNHADDERYGDEYDNIGEDGKGEDGYDPDDDFWQEGFNDWDMDWEGHDEL